MAKTFKYKLSAAEQRVVGAQTPGIQHGCSIEHLSTRKKYRANFAAIDDTNIRIIFPEDFPFSAFSEGEQYKITSNFFSNRSSALSDTWPAASVITDNSSVSYDSQVTGTPAAPARERSRTGGAGSGSGSGSSPDGGGGGTAAGDDRRDDSTEASKTERQKAVADSPVNKAALDNQASALTNTYSAAAERIKNPSEKAAPAFTAAMKSVLETEISSKPEVTTWTIQHSRLLRETAALLLNDVANPELQLFVRSYDAAMQVDISAESSEEKFGITRAGVKALQSFVAANRDTQPQKGDAQYFLRDASDGQGLLSNDDPKCILANAWALIFALRSRFRQGQDAGRIAASPVMRWPWPAERDVRDYSDSPAVSASTVPNLTFKIWVHPDRDDKFGLGKSGPVLSFSTERGSFAEKIKQLPNIFALRTPAGVRAAAVKAAIKEAARDDDSRAGYKDLPGGEKTVIDPFSADNAGWFGITSIPTTEKVPSITSTSRKPVEPEEDQPSGPPAATSKAVAAAERPATPDKVEEPPPEDVDDSVVTAFAFDPAVEPTEDETPPAQPPAQAAPTTVDAPSEDVDDSVVTAFTFDPAEDETPQAQTRPEPDVTEPAVAPSTPAAPPQPSPDVAPATPPGVPGTDPTKGAPGEEKPGGESSTTPVAPVSPTPASPPAETPIPVASVSCDVIQSLTAAEMWDLLSFRDPGANLNDLSRKDYLIASRVRVGFNQRGASKYQIENFRALFDDMGINSYIDYSNGPRLMMSTLMTRGSGSKTVLKVTNGNKDATAFDGLCMFIECILSRELEQNGFYPQ